MKQAEVIDYINAMVYEPYSVGWCKLQVIADIDCWDELDKEMVKVFLEPPNSLEECIDFIEFYLNNTFIMRIPESFMYTELSEAQWNLVGKELCLSIMDQIVQKSVTFIDKQKRLEGEKPVNWQEPWYDYEWLATMFLHTVFDPETVKFFTNLPLDKTQDAFEACEMPAVIGVDSKTIGIFWFLD